MKKISITFLTLIISISAVAEESCNDSTTFNDIIKITGKKCLTDDIGHKDLQDFVVKKDELKSFCNNCNGETANKFVTSDKGKEEKESLYGKATLDEFQKELTSISLDLMKMRSTFKLEFKADEVIKSCNIEKHLKTPDCLSADQRKQFDAQVTGIKNSLASELANILSPTPTSDGLLTRKKRANENQCNLNLSERDVLYARARYDETLITPELIIELRSMASSKHSKNGSSKMDGVLESKLKALRKHPIFSVLLNDNTKLKNFLSEIKTEDTSETIINKLYEPKFAKHFGESVKQRCDDVFTQTSKTLDNIFCKKNPSYLADDLKSMEAITGTKFANLNEEESEQHLQTLCAHLNTATGKEINFLEIRKLLNKSNGLTEVNVPISNFKSEVYDSTFNKDKMAMCEAKSKSPPCNPEDKSPGCSMLNFLELARTNEEFKGLAENSSENINLILRSLIGKGIPQKNGEVDKTALGVLKDERILPGGATTPVKEQETASSFHKKTASLANNNSKDVTPSTTKATPTPAPISTPNAQSAAANVTSNPTTQEHPAEANNESGKAASNKKTNVPNQNSFSNLSQQEQDDLMKRFGKLPQKTSKTTTKVDDEANESANYTGPDLSQAPSFTADQAPSAVADNTRVDRKIASLPDGKKAVIDPSKKVDGYNKAVADAQTYISKNGGATPTLSTPPQVTVSETSEGKNKIEIKAEDKELIKIAEFKVTLTKLLDAQRHNLTDAQAGEEFIVKLGNYEITVKVENGVYLAKSKDLPKNHPYQEYLTTLSQYFTRIILKDRPTVDYVRKTFEDAKKKNN